MGIFEKIFDKKKIIFKVLGEKFRKNYSKSFVF